MRSERVAGDLYDPTASSVDVLASMKTLLSIENPRTAAVLTSRISTGAWRITAAILQEERDLGDAAAAAEVRRELAATLMRFGYSADEPGMDHRERLFDLTIAIHEDYWSRRQRIRSDGFSTSSFARILEAVRVGTTIERITTSTRFVVTSAGAKGISASAGRERLMIPVPRKEALTTRDNLLRIARGTERDPDAHDLYRILP